MKVFVVKKKNKYVKKKLKVQISKSQREFVYPKFKFQFVLNFSLGIAKFQFGDSELQMQVFQVLVW